MDRPTLLQAPNGTIVEVKQGFSWPAFIFGPMWAFARRAWLLGLALCGVILVLRVAEEVLYAYWRSAWSALTVIVIYLCVMALFGSNGNFWLKRTLKARGYKEVSNDAV